MGGRVRVAGLRLGGRVWIGVGVLGFGLGGKVKVEDLGLGGRVRRGSGWVVELESCGVETGW